MLVAGVGVTLLTRSAIGDEERIRTMRWRLAKRGLILFVFGVWFDYIWEGTILPYYGAMFFLAAWMFTLRIRWLDRDRRGRRARRLVHPLVGVRTSPSTATTRGG